MSTIARISFALVSFTTLLVARVATPAVLQPATAGRTRRAATFIEYALLAGIALVLFFLFRSQLSNIFGDLFDRISDAISG
jgi:Flp pilus assembly pilin Flp